MDKMINNRFGKLVAVKQIKRNSRIYYNCQCDCGNYKVVRNDALKNGATKTCGKCNRTHFIDLTNKIFGRWTVISISKNTKKPPYKWVCECKCGTIKEVCGQSLRNGISKSCGCLQKQLASKQMTTHGLSKKRIYTIYRGIINRCTNKNASNFHIYGGRGIDVCKQWRNSFEQFYKDVGDPPTDKHQIDRIDTNGHYCPENVRWVTIKQNCRNRREHRLITFKGKTKCLNEWAGYLSINPTALSWRLEHWSIEKAFTTPLRPKRKSNR